jgi:nitrate reductase gamma subunit
VTGTLVVARWDTKSVNVTGAYFLFLNGLLFVFGFVFVLFIFVLFIFIPFS